VNVHPTKREVAFLHEDRLCDAVSAAIKSVIGGATTSRTFSVATSGKLLPREEERSDKRSDLIRKKQQAKQVEQVAAMESSSLEKNDARELSKSGKENTVNMDTDPGDNEKAPSSVAGVADTNDAETNRGDMADESNLEQPNSAKKTPKKRAAADENKSSQSSTKKPFYDPSRLVRTNRSLPVGALEPFLVQKETKASSGGKASAKAVTSSKPTNAVPPTTVKHKPGCPLANNLSGQQVDMTMPGAFASAICRCQIERAESLPPAPNHGIVLRNNATTVRPKKIIPTPCDYESVTDLRKEITNQNHQSLNEMLRGSTYVGAVSRNRSLIQCGIDLIMINHRELARELFYQIALLKFNGIPMAKLGGGGVDVLAAISQMLQFEEDLNSSSASKNGSLDESSTVKVNKTNADLARQATACLASKATMLEEYFSIKLEKVKVYTSNGQKQQQQSVTSLRVTGLPILLEGHSPQPHGLPLFLLRLATEVEWMEEQPCFKEICTELASFYSELPFASNAKPKHDAVDDNEDASEKSEFIDDEAKQYVKHTLFPAVSFLLVPPKNFANSGAVVKLANLTSLYKVFERC